MQISSATTYKKATVYTSEVTASEVLNNNRLKFNHIPLRDYAACPKCRTMQSAHTQYAATERQTCWRCGEARTETPLLYMDELARELDPNETITRLTY